MCVYICYIYLCRCMYIYMGDKIRDKRPTAIASKPSHAKRPRDRQERDATQQIIRRDPHAQRAAHHAKQPT